MLWIDGHESPALTKYLVGILLLLTAGAFGVVVTHIGLAIRFLAWFLSALRAEIPIELWLILLCIVVPLLGVGCFVWLRLRRPIIHSAKYGANADFDDVKWKVEKAVRRGRRSIPAENSFFGEGDPTYDPCRDVFKSLTIDYCIRGRRENKTVQEHEVIELD